jgi:hypothetical protein
MSTPIAGILTAHAGRSLSNSALPDAPVIADPQPATTHPVSRRSIAGGLRLLARRSTQLADRLEPQHT